MTQPASKRLVSEARLSDITTAATNAGIASAQSQINSSAAAAASSASAAQNSANLVGAPADTAIATAVNSTSTQTRAALDGRYPKKGDLYVNVKDYGAKGDGTTDDTAAIQAGINAGTPLFFPPGRYVASGLVPKSGMHLIGAGKGDPDNPASPRTNLRTDNGNLFASGSYMCVIENMEISGSSPNAGDLITGNWSQGAFKSVRFNQARADRRCINVFGWIDMTIEGESEMLASAATITGACFYASDSSARIAQFSFRDTRVRGGNSFPAIYIEATGGGVSLVSSVTFDNVNFEVCNGGCMRLRSVRGVQIRGCGAWDLTLDSTLPMIDIGEGGTGGAASGQILIDGWLRDNTTTPTGGDIRATASTFGLDIRNPAHHISSMWVYAYGASGRLTGAKATLDQGQNMTTDVYQNYTPTVTPTTIGSGTLTGKYKRTGNEVHAEITMVLAADTTVGNIRFSLPHTPLNGSVDAILTSSGVAVYKAGGYISGNLAYVHPLGTNGAMVTVTPTVPFTWKSGDNVVANVRYRVA